jgi:flavin reductase (DIM6/NTAB) family NADH-FMN oxidoreductase RutF
LPATPADALAGSLSLVHTLGMRYGHAGDTMTGIAARPGVTGSPILAETLTYVEARVIATLDAQELTIRVLREHLPKEWQAEWATSREGQINEARRRRGLPGTPS